MSYPTHIQMHQDHLKWQGEHSAWMADIDRWQTESSESIDGLTNVQAFLDSHNDELRDHARAIRVHGEGLEQHEVTLAELEQAGLTDRREEVFGRHFSELSNHADQMVRHERLAKHHRAILQKLEELAQLLAREP